MDKAWTSGDPQATEARVKTAGQDSLLFERTTGFEPATPTCDHSLTRDASRRQNGAP